MILKHKKQNILALFEYNKYSFQMPELWGYETMGHDYERRSKYISKDFSMSLSTKKQVQDA